MRRNWPCYCISPGRNVHCTNQQHLMHVWHVRAESIHTGSKASFMSSVDGCCNRDKSHNALGAKHEEILTGYRHYTWDTATGSYALAYIKQAQKALWSITSGEDTGIFWVGRWFWSFENRVNFQQLREKEPRLKSTHRFLAGFLFTLLLRLRLLVDLLDVRPHLHHKGSLVQLVIVLKVLLNKHKIY